jgi:hypothetical protein
MKLFYYSLLVLPLMLFCSCSCSTETKEESSSNKKESVTEKQIKEDSNQQELVNNNWLGEYIFEEEPVEANAGYSMALIWNLNIKDSTLLEINGQQTFIKLNCTPLPEKNRLTVLYEKKPGDAAPGYLKQRDTLFILKKEKGKLITEWKTFTPRLQEDFKNGIECFKKVK